ncbi:CPBP family intramembrane glutamic endopeptidase [Pseudarthrobacter sp. GA104]|uniref:CPBP family intramembrane glutamic endopeptidase n=1 Tax=Pseudarthrobacter sp. GA104 TaxID=2676311 RepID=UPI0012FBFD54|nr:type II CAAX endopeptidase family protein [Pseudarthrobacter sp. GA104]MUU73432.1 CPBP family intramembrane metalloprotease [Pseudarthrobacter sp. GA104]
MAAPSTKSRLLAVVWCFLMPLGVIGGYLGVGFAVVAAVGEPILGTIVLGGVVFLLVGAARLLRPGWLAYEPAARPLPETPRLTRMVLGGLALAFLAGQSLALWLYSLGGSTGFDQSVQARQDAGVIAALLLALVAAPLAEEMLFRGLLYALLRRRIGIIGSVLVTTTVFGLVHGNVVQFASTLPLAVLLALVYERTRVLWPCVLMHLGFNLVATFVPPVLVTPLANPVSALLLITAFLGCALMLYRKIATPTVLLAAEPAMDMGDGKEGDPRTV